MVDWANSGLRLVLLVVAAGWGMVTVVAYDQTLYEHVPARLPGTEGCEWQDAQMILLEVLQTRRTVRTFTKDSVAEDKLQALLNMVRLAPSSGNMMAWHVVVATDQATKNAVAARAYGQLWLAEAPVLLVWLANTQHSGSKYGERGAFYALQDCTIAASYFQLVAAANGLATLVASANGLATGWVGAYDDEEIATLLKIEERLGKGARVVSLMPLGISAERFDLTEGRWRRPLEQLYSHVVATPPWDSIDPQANCWIHCGEKSGPCAWCGLGLCCRAGYNGGENGCAVDQGGKDYHICVPELNR
eukprot:g66092.t1